MTNNQRNRMFKIIALALACAISIACVLMALKENIQLYFTPSELVKSSLAEKQVVRMGGMIMADSILREKKSLKIQFNVTDGLATLPVFYEGVLPDLFREGQGVIVKGVYDPQQGFLAHEVLTKHDERYTPRELNTVMKEVK